MTKKNLESSPEVSERGQETRKLILIEKRATLLLGLLLLASLWFLNGSISLGLILGGGVAILNFRWLRLIMEKVFFHRQKIHILQLVIKFSVLAAVLFLILRYTRANPIALVVGVSTLFVSLFWEMLRPILQTERKGKNSC